MRAITGKEISCKKCNKRFYSYKSRVGSRKYCSRECAKDDEYGFKPKEIICGWCGDSFWIESYLRLQDKYCKDECKKSAFAVKQKERYERMRNTPVERVCKDCKKNFQHTAYFSRVYCSSKCRRNNLSKSRKGADNPNYRGGLYEGHKRDSRQEYKHLNACSKYKKAFKLRNDYLFCEVCGVNANGTPQFQTHHIYPASKVPRHPNLHNPRNLILVCLQCHHKFHAGKTYEKEFRKLEKERKLKELFK